MIGDDDERRIVEALRGRDPAARDAAMTELHGCIGRALFQLCLRIAGGVQDAEDAVQETFVDVLRGIGSFRGSAKLSTWIYRVAIRAATRVRSRVRRSAPANDVFGQEEPAAGGDPRHAAEQRESAARLLAAIAELPAAHRTVLGLASLQELAHHDIAMILGVPVGTVGSRLHEAKNALRLVLARSR